MELGVETAQSPSAEGNKQDNNVTKAFAKRLAETREKDRTELAAALGFSSWEDAMNSGLDKKLVDAGIDPTAGKPIIENIVNSHPDVVKAKQVLAEAEKMREESQLAVLNTKYNLQLTSIDALDDETKALIAKGVAVDKAYIAVHYDELSKQSDPVAVAQKQQANSLTHLNPLPGNTAKAEAVIPVSQTDVANVRKYMPNASEDDIKKFLQKHPEYKR
jgi:hypothetical protein